MPICADPSSNLEPATSASNRSLNTSGGSVWGGEGMEKEHLRMAVAQDHNLSGN